MYMSLHPDFTLDLSATSLIGSRAKLQDIPKVEQMIVGRLRSFVVDRLVWPKRIPLRLPSLSHHTAAEEDYVWVEEKTPEDIPIPPTSIEPSTDEDPDGIDEDVTLRMPIFDGPHTSSPMYNGGTASALPPRLFPQDSFSASLRHRAGPASSTSSSSESGLPGHLPRRTAAPPGLSGISAWRANEHLLRAGSRNMPLPSPLMSGIPSAMPSPGIVGLSASAFQNYRQQEAQR